MPSRLFEDLVRRIKGEYTEMPGLCLSAQQGARLWGIERQRCEEVLEALVDRGFLTVRPDGTYGRPTEGLPPAPRLIA